ncbi:TIGR02099 family protein [Photobacterium swingsii]|uniref:TIGR02099 family protein n=1 Tax=Photobacterium swingsii TaxID=680026 RepID=A0A2T3P2B7_9GAMM|nr:YhdP family protein [Photobacterium swingsii]PSW22665.1 TIGR02099 family protein [Photobacterium swingsii]
MTNVTVRLARGMMWLVLTVLVLASIAVSGLRLLLPQLNEYREPIRQWVSAQVDMDLQIEQVEGHWRTFGPSLMLQGISVGSSDISPSLVKVGDVEVRFDLWRSAFQLRPVFKDVSIHDLAVDLTQIPSLNPNTPDLAQEPITPDDRDKLSIAQQLEQVFFVRLGNFVLKDAKVTTWTPSGEIVQIDINQLKWANNQGKHLAQGVISIVGTHLSELDVSANLSERGDLESLSGQIYAHGKNLSFTPWLRKQLTSGVDITSSEVNAELWLSLQNGDVTNGQLQLTNSSLSWQQEKQSHQIGIESGIVRVKPYREPDGSLSWRVETNAMSWQTDNARWPALNLAAEWQADKWQLAVNTIKLDHLQPLMAFLPDDEGMNVLRKLSPSGFVSDVRLAQVGDGSPRFSLKLEQFGIKQWELIPEIHKLNASISGDLHSGRAILSIQNDTLPYGDVFQAPLPIESGDVTAYWQVNEGGWRLWSDSLQVTTPHLAVNGEFRIDFPVDKPSWLSFYGEASAYEVGETWRYLPTLSLGRELTDYLSAAIRGGEAKGAQLLWYGDLQDFPYTKHDGIFQAKVPLEKAKFSFDTEWPELTDLQLDLLFENDFMYLDSRHAKTMGATAKRVTGRSELSENGSLALDVAVAAEGEDVRDYMMATPLVDSVGAALSTVQVSGPVTSEFKLDIPFDGTDVRAWGSATLANNDILIDAPPLALSHVSGQITFDNDVIAAKGIQGQLLNQAVDIGFDGKSLDTVYQVDIGVKGDWQIAPLQAQIKDPLLAHVKGQSQWQADIGVSLHDIGFNYQVDATAPLTGLSTDLPYPLVLPNKRSAQPAKLHVKGNGDELTADLLLQDVKYRTRLALTKPRLTLAASYLAIGSSQLRPLGKHTHIVNVNSDYLDGDRWVDLANEVIDRYDAPTANNRQASSPSAFPELPLPTRVNVQLKRLSLATLDWHDVALAARDSRKQWHFILGSREATGEAFWPQGKPLNVVMDKIHVNLPILERIEEDLPADKYVPQSDVPLATAFDQSMMKNMPDMDLTIKDAWLQGYRLGKVSGQLSHDEATLVLQNLQVDSGVTSLSLDGHWTLANGQNETHVAFDIDGENSSDLMGRFGISGGVEDASFSSYASIQWQGAPWSMHRETLSGEIKTETGKGFISNVGGAGRLLGLFSIDSIIRKMQLDFSGVFDNGLAFDYIRGSGKLDNGIFTTDDIKMKALAGDMFIQGKANLVDETVDARVRFNPDLTSGIPVLTAFAIAPPTALYVLAISTALAPVVDVFTQINYQIKGPIDAPIVSEKSRFTGEFVVPESMGKGESK